MSKISRALKLSSRKDLKGHQQFCKLVGGMTPAECKELARQLHAAEVEAAANLPVPGGGERNAKG